MLLKNFTISVCTVLLAGSLCFSAYADESRLQRIKDNEELRVAVNNDLKILSLQDSQTGEYKGLEPTIARMIAKEIGNDIKVTFFTTTPSNRENLLESDYADCMIGTYTATEERKAKYDVSSPYFVTNISIMVNRDSNISSIKDLVGKKIGVIENATAAKELVKYLISKGIIKEDSFNEKTFDPNTWNNKISFKSYETNAALFEDMDKNEIQAFCNDRIVLQSNVDVTRKILKIEFAPQEYGIVTLKGSDLSGFIDKLIRKWTEDGTLKKLVTENVLN